MALDALSLATVPISAFFYTTALSEATGFVWKRHGKYYLITNWHVVAALDAETRMHLLKGGARPNRFRCHFVIRVGHYERQQIDIEIRNEYYRPKWFIYPAQGSKRIDVVALPLDGDELKKSVTLLPVNELAQAKLAIMVGMEVFILGYPFGSRPPAFPVWKRGSIASEPDLVKITTGYYLVDTASRQGMSGSPVILRSWSNHILESSNFVTTTETPIDRFIGVYSGRLKTAPAEAQIGMVWHAQYIDDIIDGGVLDQEP